MKFHMVLAFMLLMGATLFKGESVQAGMEPIRVADTLFTAVSAGDRTTAINVFAPDAVATLTRQETYRGRAEIMRMVALMDHPGRHYAIVRAVMTGDNVTVDVVVSDRGIRWATETFVVEVRNGRVQTFHETALRLNLAAR